ncbi:MAG TPA: hypothetical protein VNL77_13505, partial [Roseiflexaceae bacterium]|nr:hypothetical protein [Roseiflexaceae bacterium]
QDRTPPWVASRGGGEWLRLDWSLPVAVLDVRLVGAEPGQADIPSGHQVSGEVVLFLAGQEVARQAVPAVAPLSGGGTLVRLARPVAADSLEFRVSEVSAGRAALSEVEVIGQGATPAALAGRPAVVALPVVGR